MSNSLSISASDSFLKLVEACARDTRQTKIDLLLGVYRDEHGKTPIMTAVRHAIAMVGDREDTKSYLSVTGRQGFTDAMIELVLVDEPMRARAEGIQTVGGAGALRLLFDLARRRKPDAKVWLSDPGYSGHQAIVAGAGLRQARYLYYDSVSGQLDFQGMIDALEFAERGDLVVLDACCHNPTGVDLSYEMWKEIGHLCQRKGLVPLVDVAYQGLSRGPAADVMAIELLGGLNEEVLVAVSCSKTFGIYRERAGAAIVIGPDKVQVRNTLRTLAEASFATYGVPPDHGAAVVETVLTDPYLRATWLDELTAMRNRISRVRAQLARALAGRLDDEMYSPIRRGSGLFTLLPLSHAKMTKLREDYAIYGLDNGRINLACMQAPYIRRVCDAVYRLDMVVDADPVL